MPTASESAAISMTNAISGFFWLNLTTASLMCVERTSDYWACRRRPLEVSRLCSPAKANSKNSAMIATTIAPASTPFAPYTFSLMMKLPRVRTPASGAIVAVAMMLMLGGADPGHDARNRHRDLHLAQHLELGHADPARRVDGRPIDLADAGEGVGEDRWDARAGPGRRSGSRGRRRRRPRPRRSPPAPAPPGWRCRGRSPALRRCPCGRSRGRSGPRRRSPRQAPGRSPRSASARVRAPVRSRRPCGRR